MIKKLLMIAGALGVIGAATGGALYYFYPVQVSIFAGLTRNYIVSSTPPGTITTELNAAYKAAEAVVASSAADVPSASATGGDWPSYNRTVTSDRYSPLSEINTKNVGQLKVLCTYDVGEYSAFETGLIMVENALIGTTVFDIFSLNPATCALNWRTHEDYPPAFCPPTAAPPTWTACCFAAPRTAGCSPMTSRPASEFGKRPSRTRNMARR